MVIFHRYVCLPEGTTTRDLSTNLAPEYGRVLACSGPHDDRLQAERWQRTRGPRRRNQDAPRCHISDIDWLLTISYLYYIYTYIYVQNIDGNEINMDTPQL